MNLQHNQTSFSRVDIGLEDIFKKWRPMGHCPNQPNMANCCSESEVNASRGCRRRGRRRRGGQRTGAQSLHRTTFPLCSAASACEFATRAIRETSSCQVTPDENLKAVLAASESDRTGAASETAPAAGPGQEPVGPGRGRDTPLCRAIAVRPPVGQRSPCSVASSAPRRPPRPGAQVQRSMPRILRWRMFIMMLEP